MTKLKDADESAHATRDRQLFDAIAQSYCRKDLHRASQLARRQRLEASVDAAGISRAGALLEVGCGAGFAARYLAGRYRSYVGIDYAAELVRLAREHNALPGARFEAAGIRDFMPRERFDMVLMIGVLHLLDDMLGTLRHIAELLVPGGFLVANEPQPANPVIRVARQARKRLDARYSSDQIELTAKELGELYAAAGFVDVKLVPQGLFATPFAEVALPAERLMVPFARLACALDRSLAGLPGMGKLSWNLIAVGRKPAGSPS